MKELPQHVLHSWCRLAGLEMGSSDVGRLAEEQVREVLGERDGHDDVGYPVVAHRFGLTGRTRRHPASHHDRHGGRRPTAAARFLRAS